MELPDKKVFIDYYKTIADPISLQEIEVCLGCNSQWDGLNFE